MKDADIATSMWVIIDRRMDDVDTFLNKLSDMTLRIATGEATAQDCMHEWTPSESEHCIRVLCASVHELRARAKVYKAMNEDDRDAENDRIKVLIGRLKKIKDEQTERLTKKKD